MSVSIVLLCEDIQTDCFVRRFLRYRGFDHRDIRDRSASGISAAQTLTTRLG